MSNKLRKKLKLSKENEAILISFMKQNSFMWDMRIKDYKNNAKKEEKWIELSQILQRDVESIKKRWKSLKDYRKSRKKNPTGTTRTTDDEEEKKGKDDCLDFLSECPTQRLTSSNRNISTASDNNTTGDDTDTEMLYEEFQTQKIEEVKIEQKDFEFENEDNSYFDSGQLSTDIEGTSVSTNIYPESSVTASSCSSSLRIQPRKHTKKPIADYKSIMKDKNVALNEIVQIQQETKNRSIMEKYFEAFLAGITVLPPKLQAKCQREVQQALMSIIHKYQDMAEQMEDTI